MERTACSNTNIAYIGPTDFDGGTWTLDLPGASVTVLGGPYPFKPDEVTWGLCLAPEVAQGDVTIAVPDFGVPSTWDMYKGLRRFCMGILAGKPEWTPERYKYPAVYVGCRGGIGRTGMAMGCLARVMCPGYNGVSFVRDNYLARAVETKQQEEFVAKFPARLLRWDLKITQAVKKGIAAMAL